MNKKIIAVIGDATATEQDYNLAFELGKLIIDNNFRLANGGFGGIMEGVSKGARYSEKYSDGSIIGVLPDYDKSHANNYIDIPIPTGAGLMRNTILISMCDAVIAIGGGAGTLNEIATAWQMNKLIIGMGNNGWANKLKNIKLDKRRNDSIHEAKTALQAIEIINEKIYDDAIIFEGVKPYITNEKARHIVREHFHPQNELKLLGRGSEGIVLTDDRIVYKVFNRSKQNLQQYWLLCAFKEAVDKGNCKCLFSFEVDMTLNHIVISYPYEETSDYKGGLENELTDFLKDLKNIAWVMTDFQAKNFRINKNGKLVLIDIGHSLSPFTANLFRKMCLRAFLVLKLNHIGDIKYLLSETNHREDFHSLESLGLNRLNFQKEFAEFFHKVVTLNKKEVLNPLLLKAAQLKTDIRTVLDYGSGHGDVAKLFYDNHYEISAFEIDENLFVQYKSNYNGIPCYNIHSLPSIIHQKFDLIICSLVLSLYEIDLKELENIIENLNSLSGKYILISISNPLCNFPSNSTLQKKNTTEDFDYLQEQVIEKKIHITGNLRKERHRPLLFYEELFKKMKWKVINIQQSKGFTQDKKPVLYPDFIIYFMEKQIIDL